MTVQELVKFIETGFNNLSHRLTNVENRDRSEVAGGAQRYTVATLPTPKQGSIAFATDGRKVGEGVGSGTGVFVYADGSLWYKGDDTAVEA